LDHRDGDITPQHSAQSAQPARREIPAPDPQHLPNTAFGFAVPCPAPDFSTPPEPGRKTIVLPPGPSSITLFLTAFGSLGAWQFVRSARNARFRLGPLPEWYHTGGPIQVGGAAAFDFHYTPPAMCTLNEPAGEQQLRHHPRRDLPSRREDQFLLTVEAPRGPPRLCS